MASVQSMQQVESVEQKFQRLAAEWRAETGHLSSITKMFNHPAYQEIIGLGADVMPSLLRDLQKKDPSTGSRRCEQSRVLSFNR